MHNYKFVMYEVKKINLRVCMLQILTAVGTRCADHVTPLYPQKLALTSPLCRYSSRAD